MEPHNFRNVDCATSLLQSSTLCTYWFKPQDWKKCTRSQYDMQIAHEVIFAFRVQTGDFLDLILTVIWIRAQFKIRAYRSKTYCTQCGQRVYEVGLKLSNFKFDLGYLPFQLFQEISQKKLMQTLLTSEIAILEIDWPLVVFVNSLTYRDLFRS